MASQNLGFPKSGLAKVRKKNVGIHLVECHDIVVSTFFSYEIEEVSSCFDIILAVQIGVPIFLLISQSIAKTCRHALILVGQVLAPNQSGPTFIYPS